MFFVKDLGPIAQMIARRKLIGCSVDASSCWSPDSKRLFQQPECQNHNAFHSTQRKHPILDTAFNVDSENLIDHLHRVPNISGNAIHKVDTSYAGAGRKALLIHNPSVEVASSSNERKIPVGFRGGAHSANAVDGFGLFCCDSFHQDQCSESQLDYYPSSVGAREFNLSVAGLKNSGKTSTPIVMVKSNCHSQASQLESSLAQSQANTLDLRSRNNSKFSPSCPEQTIGSSICIEMKGSGCHIESPFPRSGDQNIHAKDEVEVRGSVKAGQEWKGSQTMRVGSQFIFDLPFLRKRLDQINSFGKEKIFQQGPGNEDPFPDKVNWKRQSACSHQKELLTETYNDSYKQLSSDAQHGDFALQW